MSLPEPHLNRNYQHHAWKQAPLADERLEAGRHQFHAQLARFSVNMGTGIISILLHTAPHQFPGLKVIATVFYVLNIALFTLFAAISILRYTLYPWIFPRMLHHPTQSLFPGTLLMGFATL